MVWVFVGSRDDSEESGFVQARFDASKGQFLSLSHNTSVSRPTWIQPASSGTGLFMTSSKKDGADSQIVSIAFDTKSGDAQIIGKAASGGVDPTYIGHNTSKSVLYVANFRDAKISVLRHDETFDLAPPFETHLQEGSGPHERQSSAHPHAASISPCGQFVLSPDLGADRVFVYQIEPEYGGLKVKPDLSLEVPAGSGPRHLTFHPTLPLCYLLLELTAEILVLNWNQLSGQLTLRNRISMVSEGYAGKISASELACSRDGRFLYATNRGEHQIIVYAVEPDLTLREVQREPCGGLVPWHFALTPCESWLLIANFKSGNVSVFQRDHASGRLVLSGAELRVSQAANIAFVSE